MVNHRYSKSAVPLITLYRIAHVHRLGVRHVAQASILCYSLIMVILLALVAFAWLMGINLYILLYQQRNVALVNYLRSYYPDVYEKTKNRLFFGMLTSEKQTRNALIQATDGGKLEDANIDQVLTELTELRQRGMWSVGPLTLLMIVLLVVLYFGT